MTTNWGTLWTNEQIKAVYNFLIHWNSFCYPQSFIFNPYLEIKLDIHVLSKSTGVVISICPGIPKCLKKPKHMQEVKIKKGIVYKTDSTSITRTTSKLFVAEYVPSEAMWDLNSWPSSPPFPFSFSSMFDRSGKCCTHPSLSRKKPSPKP